MRDLIVLIIIVAISIISSVVKANKKAKEKHHTSQPKNENDSYGIDPWDDIIMETGSNKPKQALESAYNTVSPSNLSDESIEIESIIRRRSEDVAKRNENNKQTSPIFNDDIQASHDGQEELKNKMLHNFNVVDAVIYSEILKPKF